MSRKDLAARYGAAQADLDLVVEFARNHGLAVVETSIARRVVIVSGTVEQMGRAFAVELGRYESPTETYRGREGHIHLPQRLADIVEGVFGLDNRQMARALVVRATARPEDVIPLTPPVVADFYKFPTPANAAGQFIGVIGFSGGADLRLHLERHPDVLYQSWPHHPRSDRRQCGRGAKRPKRGSVVVCGH